jgi:hypothetical protein
MVSGEKHDSQLDPLTRWELAALNIIIALDPKADWDVNAVGKNMLTLVQALDRGDLDPVLEDEGFLSLTENLLLAILHGDKIEVTDQGIYAARNEVIAAAQVVYNQAIARGFWDIHPEITEALKKD